MPSVLIRGEGIAASCCARLLGNARVRVTLQALVRPKVPAVMLTETTQRLLRDVFGRDDLFSGLHQIRRRIVAWGPDSKPLALPHAAVVVSEEELLRRIRQEGEPGPQDTKREDPDWTIFASPPLPSSCVTQQFGSRPAGAALARLKSESDPEACWIESLENGWLFLLPGSEAAGWLLSVGDSAESMLQASRVIKDQIVEFNPSRGSFPSHPRIALPLSEPGWLGCGTAALGFDPLCGDGAGNAVREAILGSAVVRAAMAGGDVFQLTTHYHSRLLAAFQRHLAVCLGFYRSGHSGNWWDTQVDDLERGMRWCSEQLANPSAARYRLNDFTLEPA